MKLVIATPLYPPEIGGPATYAKLLEEGLPAYGITPVLIKFGEVRHFPKFFRNYLYYRRVLAAARTADVVLALDPVSVGLPAQRAAKKAGKPFVVKIVGDYAWEQGQQRFGVTQTLDEFLKTQDVAFPVRLFRNIQTRVAKNATKIIVPSLYLANVVAAWGIPREKIEVIYNAVDSEEMGVVPAAVAALPRPLVVTAGRLVPWKQIDGVIDAVGNTSGVSLAIVGDGPLRPSLVARTNEKLPERAVFTGAVAHADLLAILQSADVFIANASYEGLSHLLIEAQMLGVASIATSVGGNPEVITDGKDGLLVPNGEAHALTGALTRLLGDERLRAQLEEAAKESAKRFSKEKMLEKTAHFLTKL